MAYDVFSARLKASRVTLWVTKVDCTGIMVNWHKLFTLPAKVFAFFLASVMMIFANAQGWVPLNNMHPGATAAAVIASLSGCYLLVLFSIFVWQRRRHRRLQAVYREDTRREARANYQISCVILE
jgi:membrane associated rhomboid family serine protease